MKKSVFTVTIPVYGIWKNVLNGSYALIFFHWGQHVRLGRICQKNISFRTFLWALDLNGHFFVTVPLKMPSSAQAPDSRFPVVWNIVQQNPQNLCKVYITWQGIKIISDEMSDSNYQGITARYGQKIITITFSYHSITIIITLNLKTFITSFL